MAAAIEVKGTSIAVGKIEPLFGAVLLGRGFDYDISRDGQQVFGTATVRLLTMWLRVATLVA
jgi:hypothetical protein